MSERLLYETHSHTPLCNHAVGEPEEYAAAAEARGLRGLTVTCHNPMPDGFSSAVRMRPQEFDTYVAMVERARAAWEGSIDVRLGLEADYFAGYERWLERQLQSAPFNFVLGSVHPQLGEYRQRYQTGDVLESQRTYFRLLADAAETRLFDSLAHPDLIKNEYPDEWDPSLIMDTICESLDRIAATGTAMELNTSGLNKSVSEMNPGPAILREMRSRGIPVTLGADAHTPHRVADNFETALALLAQCGYEEVSCFLERKRCDISIDAALQSLVQPAGSR